MRELYCKYIRPYNYASYGDIWAMRINLFPISVQAVGNSRRDNMLVVIDFSWRV